MYFGTLIICVVLVNVQSQGIQETRIVNIDQGPVRGYKNPGEGFYSFYNIPFATVRERFKAPSPPPTWTTPFDAVDRGIICPQGPVSYVDLTNKTMQEDCLVINVYVPETNKTNLPVLVDVHGGAFHAGFGATYSYNSFATSNNVIIVTYNYRIGILGFICMGTENIPGNAGMKDVVAGLRWVQRNIASFGGNPNDVTLTGCSAGGSAIDLLPLSNITRGLFNQVIIDSGSNLATYGVQSNPIEVAKQHAELYNFTDFHNFDAVERFFLTEPFDTFIKINSNCGPCVERDVGEEMFLTEAPYTILNRGDYIKYPTLYGLSDMEGLFPHEAIEVISQILESNFANFLPSDLQFSSEEERQRVAESVKYFYFGNESIASNFLKLVDFQSDITFVTSILRTVKLNVNAGHREFYLYEYSFYEEDAVIKGAPHCAQARAARDEDETNLTEDYRRVKTFIREFWFNFMTAGNPVINATPVASWPTVGQNRSPHLSVGRSIELRGPLMQERAEFWDAIYERHYRVPVPPTRDSASSLAPRNVAIIAILLTIYTLL
ncbi:esterase FE4 [Manduca sexta]|uniref:Carboxylic ester hydrolase n=1 Tax=Manduca sexta TaxID=7130 RepID=A0A921YP75_MANSE|nr:esterase FE4 [Manduca sexta]KAG6442934.1 hypothetical protein O3G_MSEX002576 [Manduca sexta]KAG6442935.1 hypothetical protein O3G_MSEX002576 [Manduca sexta]UXP71937.1 esterase [Manduca sexta]